MRLLISRGILALFIITWMSCSEKHTMEVVPLPSINYNTINFEHSMKGWELYSWPNGNDWNYSIVIGTNILKTYSTITENPIAVTGIDSLKKILQRMPQGEEIVWIGEDWLSQIWSDDYRDLMLPSEEIIYEVNKFCQDSGLLLIIAY